MFHRVSPFRFLRYKAKRFGPQNRRREAMWGRFERGRRDAFAPAFDVSESERCVLGIALCFDQTPK